MQMTINKSIQEIEKVVTSNLSPFEEFIALETVSTQNREIRETAEYVAQMFEKLGGEAEILDDLEDSYPFVYGFFEAGPGGNKEKTLLFYNHYDVQPEEPVDLWKTPPFELTQKDGKLVGRGVSDDKGELMARLYAIQMLQETEEGLPVNIKFIVEGEEEIGSPHIDAYLEKYADLFEADVCFWEGGNKDANENIVLYGGVKGIAYFDVWVDSADTDIHSSRGAIVNNAAWRLVQALATLRTSDNQITVDAFYDLMEEPSDKAKEVTAQMPFDAAKEQAVYGLKHPLITEDLGIPPQEALMLYPTLTISGLESGYNGPGAKTILPKTAKAKLDFRLVPGYTGDKVEKLLRAHLDNHGFEDVQIKLITQLVPFRTDLEHPYVDLVVEAAHEVYGEDKVVLEPNMPGGGPMYGFKKFLDVPIMSTGVGWAQANVHAPNENIRLKDFYQGIAYIVTLLEKLK
jgi:acetylornithine deacetylase/succinyl-diaminopimelate desuccinylase-like protein